jgi:hypothetical protein
MLNPFRIAQLIKAKLLCPELIAPADNVVWKTGRVDAVVKALIKLGMSEGRAVMV